MIVNCKECHASTEVELKDDTIWRLMTLQYVLLNFRCKARGCNHVTQVKARLRVVGDRPRVVSVQE